MPMSLYSAPGNHSLFMRIALFYKQLSTLGGAEKLVLKEAYHLTKLTGFKVPILCINSNMPMIEALKIEDVFIYASNDKFPHFRLAQFVKQNRINHIISSSGHIDCFLISQLAGCSYSLHVHHPLMMSPTDKLKYAYSNRTYYRKKSLQSREVNFLEYQRLLLNPLDILNLNIYDLLYKLVLRKAKCVFVLSEYSKLEKEEMLNCRNAVSLSGAISALDINPNRYKAALANKREINLLCLGRLVWDKRFDLVINAVEILNTLTPFLFNLHIVGCGPHESYLKGISNSKSTIFHGAINQSELNLLWDKTDIFCTPDWADFKLTMYESLSRGILTLVSNETDVAPILHDSGYVVCVTPNVSSIAKKIYALTLSNLRLSEDLLRESLAPLLWDNYFSKIYGFVTP